MVAWNTRKFIFGRSENYYLGISYVNNLFFDAKFYSRFNIFRYWVILKSQLFLNREISLSS